MEDPSVRLIRRNPAFAWYWLGQSLSSAGSQVTVLALPLVTALALDGRPRDVGFVATAAMLPYLLFSLLAGHWLEGRNKRRVMIPADLIQAVLLAVVPVAWVLDLLSVPLLAMIAFLAGTAALCFGVVGFSYVPEIVEQPELAAANRAIQGSRTVTEIAGPGAAGFLVGALGAPLAMTVDALTYVASAVGVALGRHRNARPGEKAPGPAGPEATKARMTDGLRVLWRNPYLRSLTVHAALYNLASEIFTLNLVLWVVKQQGLSPGAYGLAMGAGGVGGLIGTVTALALADRVGFGRAFVASLALSCVVPIAAVAWVTGGTTLAVVLGVVMLLSGIGLGKANVYSLTLRQTVIPDDQLTRSAGAYTQVMYGSIPIGGALAGVLGEALGTREAALAGAVGLAVSALPMVTRRILALRDTATAKAARDS